VPQKTNVLLTVAETSDSHQSNAGNLFLLQLETELSLRLTAIFPGGPGLAGTKMSPFWIYWS